LWEGTGAAFQTINRFKEERMKRRFVAVVSAAAILALGTSAAFAGEITGNGTLKTVHGNSPCAYSGQEDLQWFLNDGDTIPRIPPIKGQPHPDEGMPSRVQNWGQTKQASGLPGGANNVEEIEWGCNGHLFGLK
jgi:hypothetical protein